MLPVIPTLAPSWANFNFRWSCSPFTLLLLNYFIISTAGDEQPLWAMLPSFLFPSLGFACIVSYPFTVFPSVCLFSLWPFTRYLKTGIKLFLYYLFFRPNKPGSLRHKDSTPDAASQVSSTVKKNFLSVGSYTFVWSFLSTARVKCNLFFFSHQNSQDILMPARIHRTLPAFFQLFPSLYCCMG